MQIRFPQINYSPEGEGVGSGSAPAAPANVSDGGNTSPSSAPSGGPSQASGSDLNPVSAPQDTQPTPEPGAFDPDELLAGLGGDFGEDDEFSELGQQEAQPGAQEQAPPVQPQQSAPPTQTPQPQQQQPQQPTGPQEDTASIPPPSEPGQIALAMEQNSQAIIEHLAQNEFQLSPEEVEALETDAAGTLPTIFAKMYLRSQMSALRQMERVVPAMLQNFVAVQKRNNESANKFYSRWPDIKKNQHGDLVTRMAVAYRTANPQASLEQMIEDLGPMVMMAAKIQPGQQVRPNGNNGSPTGFRPPPSSPFKPAVGGPASPQQSEPDNPWMGLGGYDSDEE